MRGRLAPLRTIPVVLATALALGPAAHAVRQGPPPLPPGLDDTGVPPPSARLEVEMEMEMEGASPTVGDRVEARLVLDVDPLELAGEPAFPEWGESWGEAEVLEAGPVTREELPAAGEADPPAGRRVRFTQRLVLAAFRPGAVPLSPPAAVTIPTAAGTSRLETAPDLALTIASVMDELEADETSQPRPPRGLRHPGVGAAFWWTNGGLAALLAALVVATGRGRPVLVPARQRPGADPLGELLAALERLRTETSAERLHTASSLALRRYLGIRLGFPAQESTTREIETALAARPLPAALGRKAVELLRTADGVKFAGEGADERGMAKHRELTALAAEGVERWHARPPGGRP